MRTMYKRLLPSLRVLVVCLITGGAAMAQNTPAAKPPATKQDSSRGKASDTSAQAADVLKRLAAIENELQKVTSEMKRLQPNEAPSSKQLKALGDTLALSKRQNEDLLREKKDLNTSITKLNNELSQARDSLASAKKAAKEERGLLTKQLEAEITAVVGMGEEVPDALLKSMLKRTAELSPSNKEEFKKFTDYVSLLQEARRVLEAAPNSKTLTDNLVKLKDTNMAFPKLDKYRQDLLKLLEKYCQRSKDLATRISDAGGLSGDRRTSFLEDARYLTKESTYLKGQLDKALADPAHRMPTPNCN